MSVKLRKAAALSSGPAATQDARMAGITNRRVSCPGCGAPEHQLRREHSGDVSSRSYTCTSCKTSFKAPETIKSFVSKMMFRREHAKLSSRLGVKKCKDCNGFGTADGTDRVTQPDCKTCNGSGWMMTRKPEEQPHSLGHALPSKMPVPALARSFTTGLFLLNKGGGSPRGTRIRPLGDSLKQQRSLELEQYSKDIRPHGSTMPKASLPSAGKRAKLVKIPVPPALSGVLKSQRHYQGGDVCSKLLYHPALGVVRVPVDFVPADLD